MDEMLYEILQDELKYCFDLGYNDNETWLKINPNKTRIEAFAKVANWLCTATKEEIDKEFDYQYKLK